MKRTNQLIFILVILIIALGAAIYFRSTESLQERQPEVVQSPVQEPIKKPIIHYPLPETPAPQHQDSAAPQTAPDTDTDTDTDKGVQTLPETLPAVQDSDKSIETALTELFNDNGLPKFLLLENFIQRLVATIDNLPEKKLPRIHLPVKPPHGKFIVSGTPEQPQTSSRNNQRYTIYVGALEAVSPDLAVKIYIHFYPLFQKAYEQLGYKNAYFNDRLVFVLDHLLETPNPADPLSLSQPVVLYTYADPTYENMSAGQKMLLRIGQDNRTRVLNILQEYRRLVTGQHP